MYLCKNDNVKILSELPKNKNGNIDRKAMVGMSLNIEYYGVIYENIEIVDFYRERKNVYKFKVKYNDEISEIRTSNMMSGKFGSILEGSSNTIWNTDRWMCDLGISEEDAKKYSKGSNKKIEVTCPYCGRRKKMAINSINRTKSIGCICGDGISYPEKFMYNLLLQIRANFTYQLSKTTFEWCGKYKYDFYIPELNCIIETHGRQHYEDCYWGKASDAKLNDNAKEKLAKDHGIKNYIVIDCRYSELEWIKDNIINSKLNDIFDLSKIDWETINLTALTNNIVKEVCDYWNNKRDNETAITMALDNPWGIKNSYTIVRYLKTGDRLGWTNYNPKEEMRKCGSKNGKALAKKVEVYKDGEYIKTFDSLKKLEEASMSEFGIIFSVSGVSYFCLNGSKKGTYKGYVFKYVN